MHADYVSAFFGAGGLKSSSLSAAISLLENGLLHFRASYGPFETVEKVPKKENWGKAPMKSS
jgi:hypothetical protein